MSYGPFEALEASESEHRIAANAAFKDLDGAIVAVKTKHGRYLNNATSQDDFFGRVANVKTDMREIVQSFGIHPAKGPMRRVVNACRADARPRWMSRQSAAGTQVDDAAPPPDTTSPVGVLDETPVGSVIARRRTASGWHQGLHEEDENPPTEEDLAVAMDSDWDKPRGDYAEFDRYRNTHPRPRTDRQGRRFHADDQVGYESQPYVPQDTTSGELGTDHLASTRVGGGFRDFMEQGLRGLSEGVDSAVPGGGPMGDLVRGLDQGIEGELPRERGGKPREYVHPEVAKHPEKSWQTHMGEGLRDGYEQALSGVDIDGMHVMADFRQVLAEADRMADGGLGDAPALIPEGSFDSYLNSVTGPETDKAAERPFGSREGDDNWVNTAGRRIHGEDWSNPPAAPSVPGGYTATPVDPQGVAGQGAAIGDTFANPTPAQQQVARRRQAEDYATRGRAESDGSNYDFTGSPETQYHHRQKAWGGAPDEDALYDLMHQGMDFDTARAQLMKGAAVLYADWAHDRGHHAGSARVAHAWGHLVGPKQYSRLLSGVHLAQGIRRTAAGKDHLQTSQDSITKMLNELAEDFQKSIMPLQDALQSVQFAQQSMAAQQSPMNVMPPGSVNVLPGGMDPAAAGGGDPMQGQGMPAAPGPSGLSPMADPNATGGMPAPGADPSMGGAPPGDPAAAGGAPAPGGDPAAGGGALPPEVMQILQQIPPEVLLEVATQELMGGGGGAAAPPAPGGDPAAAGGDPSAGGAPPEDAAPAQRPVASKKKWYDDDSDDDDESDSDDGFGGKKAPPFGKKSAWQRYADANPFAKGDDDGPPQDGPPKGDDGPPKKDGPPEHHDGPPHDGPPPPEHGGGDPIVDSPEFHAFCEANDIPFDHLAPEDQDEVIAVFVDVIKGLQHGGGGAPPPQGPPPGPPQDLPPGPPPQDLPPPPQEHEARHHADRYLRWARHYDLPIDQRTVRMYLAAENQDRAQRSRRPFVSRQHQREPALR